MYMLVLVAGILAAPHPQVADGGSYFETKLVGDGSPRQAYLYEQVTVSTSPPKSNSTTKPRTDPD